MGNEPEWTAVVVRRSRGLMDGSNLYRRVTVRHEDGREETIRVDREVWSRIEVGDRLVRPAGGGPRPA